MAAGNILTPIEPFTPKEQAIIEVSRQFFWFFLLNVFTKSFEGQSYLHDDGTRREFTFGRMHVEWAILAQYNPRLCIMAPRAHLKTTVLVQAFAFWQMFRIQENDLIDILYFSYKTSLAIEKVEDLLRLIRSNPYCRYWKDLKPYGRTQVNYLIEYGTGTLGEVSMKGDGILSATRGRHPRVTICDDILSDFSNPLTSMDLHKIGRVFRQAIMSLPANPDDPLVLVGTPQSYEDILYTLSTSEDWMWLTYPAIMDEKNKIVQWPEKFTFERLKKVQRNVGPTAFEVEYQLTPIKVTDQFFTREEILSVTDEMLEMWDLRSEFEKHDLAIYGGFDVGKRVHPSHVSIFLELPSGTLVQIYERFLDQYKYNIQVKILNRIAKVFRLSRGYYDASFNALDDRGLDPVWRGKAFNRKLKADMAVLFEKKVFANIGEEPGIVLLNDPRQLRQITLVDKQLTAAQTVEGHGDAFWSIGLAIKAAEDGPSIIGIGSATPSYLHTRRSMPGRNWVQQLGART